jgi:hypothetical protein
MTLSKHALPPCQPTGIRALWGFIKESLAIEFRSTLRLLAAPLRALWTGSADPIRSALRSAEEDRYRPLNRYIRRAQQPPDFLS